MRKLLVLVSLLFAGSAEAKLRVVTSIETFADLARRVGGDRVEVQTLGKGYMDPHFVEPKPNLVLALNRADLLVHVGLELEIGWLPPLVLGARNEKIAPGAMGNLDISSGIPVLDVPTIKVDRSMGDIHPSGNPHYWVPPDNALIVAREIEQRLEALDPSGRESYQKNLKSFESELAARRAEWEKLAAPLRGLKVVTYHKSWSYLSKWLGLVEIGYLEPKPGIPPSPSHIAWLITTMRQDAVKLLLMESFYPRNTAELVASKSGARAVVLPSDVNADKGAGDYFALVDEVVKKLVEAAHLMRANAAGLPITLDVEGRVVVLVGSGDEADHKRELLTQAGAQLRAVDAAGFAGSVLDGAFLVMVAVHDEALAERVHAAAKSRGVLCWACDNPPHSDLAMPAIARVGAARIAISTSGASPGLSGRLRAAIETGLGEKFARFVDVLAALRERALQDSDETRRRATLLAALEGFQLELSARYPAWFK